MNGRAIKLEGNPDHPVNRGKLCARGQAGLQLLYNPDRVTGAVQQAERGSRKFEPIAWNEAVNTLVDKIEVADGQVAVWVGSTTPGHLVHLFRRFTQALGAPSPVRYDLYSGLNGYAVLANATGTLFDRTGLPAYDLGHADVIFSFGADFLGTWLSATGYGVAYGAFRDQEFGKRGYLAQFEPRMSTTGAVADRWIPVQPGAEALVAQAIARVIADEGPAERAERAAALVGEVDVERAAQACGLSVEALKTLAHTFATAERPLAIPGRTLTGQNDAVTATAAVQALNVIAGTVGQPGGMSITPVLPLADFAVPPVSTFADLQNLIGEMAQGNVKVLLVHGANPAYDLPEDAGFITALKNVDTVVSFNPLVDETSALADMILPDRVYLESWGYEIVTPGLGGVPIVSSQQPVVPPLHDVHPTANVLLSMVDLGWETEVDFLKEMVAKLPTTTTETGDTAYRWARFLQRGGWWLDAPPDDAIPQVTASAPIEITPPPALPESEEDVKRYALHLYLPVMLGDGSGASQPWLQGSPDPMTTVSWGMWIELNPETAQELDVKNGDVVRVTSAHGEIEALVYVYPAIRPDTVAIPVGQGHTDLGRYAQKRGSNPINLVGAESNGDHLAWSDLEVTLERTGKHQSLAVFESTIEPPDFVHSPV